MPYIIHLAGSAAAVLRTSQLRACDQLFTAIGRDSKSETINVDFSKGDIFVDLNGFCTNNKIRHMLEEADFDQLHFVFSLGASFGDRAIGEPHRHSMTHVHTIFSGLPHLPSNKNIEHVLAPLSLNKIQHRVQNFEAFLKDTFNAWYEIGHCILKLHLIDHIIEDLDRSGCLEILSSSACELCNFHIKRTCRSISRRCTSAS